MSKYNAQQRNYQREIYDDEKPKDPIVALILTFLLGPLGLCYVTTSGGIFLIMIIIFTKWSFVKASCWAVAIIWAAIATNRHLMNKFEQFIGKKSFYQQDLPLYPLDSLEIDDVDEGHRYRKNLNRKDPHSRHFFMFFRVNDEIHSGLSPDYSPFFNTVIRPDIDVWKDVQDINTGNGTIPKDHIAEIKKLRNREFIYYGIVLCFTLPFLVVGSKEFLLIFVTSIITLLLIRPFKASLTIEALEFEDRQTEWLINGRVYGEQLNELGQNVLYPKRGEGFYALTGLEYLQLYTLQFYKGDKVKSDILFQNLVKGVLQNQHEANDYIRQELRDETNKETYRNIRFYGVKFLEVLAPKWVKNKNLYNLANDPSSKIEAIYDECCSKISFERFI
jgi:hypothetical protein